MSDTLKAFERIEIKTEKEELKIKERERERDKRLKRTNKS
jgi:hypothetical protein